MENKGKLQFIQKLLEEVTPKASPVGDEMGSDYNQLIRAFRVVARERTDIIVQHIGNRISAASKSHLRDQPVGDPFRVCSVGCGDGERDCSILREALKTVSNTVALRFVGIDIDETSCRNAELAFKELPSVETTILNKDILKVDTDTLPKFDLVYMNHGHYYIKDFKSLVEVLKHLVKVDTGSILIVSASQSPINSLIKIFFEKEHDSPLRRSEELLRELDEMGVKYQVELHMKGVFNFNRCFTEGFSSKFSKDVLNIITRTRRFTYPEEVTKAVIEYIQVICRQSPDKGYVCDFCDTAITL